MQADAFFGFTQLILLMPYSAFLLPTHGRRDVC
jgi:hypothetical protein